jgi:hypothetical protein
VISIDIGVGAGAEETVNGLLPTTRQQLVGFVDDGEPKMISFVGGDSIIANPLETSQRQEVRVLHEVH